MKLFKRDIPPRAALAVVALVLIASIVNGQGQQADPAAAAPAVAPRAAAGTAAADSLANLDIEKLRSTTKQAAITDVLAHREVPSGDPIAENGAAAAPVAPPLPFSYLGQMIDGGKTTVFIGHGAEHYIVEAGMTVENNYRVERVTDTQITFVFLPLGTRQVLPVPSHN
jgi:hypothetical protein